MRQFHRRVAAALFAALALPAGAAEAAEPVAIVQDVAAAEVSVAFMDYVYVGDVITLRAGERLVLGYFASCLEEHIVGGTVTIGPVESAVADGAVERRKVECDSSAVGLSERQANASGVVVFRNAAKAAPAAAPKVKLYGLSPIVRSEAAGTLTISRVDKPAPPISLTTRAGATDLAKRHVALAPGGIYRAELTVAGATRSILFETDAFAKPGQGPIVSRLLRF